MNAARIPQIEDFCDLPVTFPSLMDEIPIGIVLLDPDCRIVLVNRTLEGLTGFVRQEAMGIPCAHILRCNVCLEKCPARNWRPGSDAVSMEGNIINRDRQKIPVRISFSSLRDLNGTTVGFIETVEDIRLLRAMEGNIGEPYGYGRLIGRSPQIERIFQILPIVAQSDSSVLITGETGTGKDFVAEAIHQASPRARNPFIKVNCGALPETLLESELFGHQKGAFTGAVENKPGRFRLAHNGTLYLTEIGDLPLALQVKLLTFLDDKVVYPLGSTKGFNVNVRVIAATHRNLEQMVKHGQFREDLLFRLNVVRLHLPPLRDRGDDIRLLLDHFFHTYLSQFKKPIKGLSGKALRILLDYSYPGNVRELRNIIEYALNICQEDQIQRKHLPAYVTAPTVRDVEREENKEEIPLQPSFGRQEADSEVEWAVVERRMIVEALLKAKGRRNVAAGLLGWGRSTLWRKMKHYGLV